MLYFCIQSSSLKELWQIGLACNILIADQVMANIAEMVQWNFIYMLFFIVLVLYGLIRLYIGPDSRVVKTTAFQGHEMCS